MFAISAFQDAAGNLKPKEFHSSSAHESWAITTELPGCGVKAYHRWPEGRSERGASKAKDSLQGFVGIRFIRGQNLFPDSASSASLREKLVDWLKTGTRFGGRTLVASGCAAEFGGGWR